MVQTIGTVQSLADAGLFLSRGRDPRSRRIANNTWIEQTEKNPDAYGVRLHRTLIIEYRDGETVFNTGGWNTVTTRDRLNEFAPVGIRFYSERGDRTGTCGTLYAWDRIAETCVPAFDGIVLRGAGAARRFYDPATGDRVASEAQALAELRDDPDNASVRTLETAARTIAKQPRTSARALFPDRPKGYTKAAATLGDIAWNLASAKRNRLAGHIANALPRERHLETLWLRLPEYARH